MAAEQGRASTQLYLGDMYRKGEGVLQNDILAHMWLNISGANGDEDARKNRDIVAERMTPQDISAAQEQARVCMNTGYQECD